MVSQEIEEGANIVSEILRNLATQLNQPKINGLSFERTSFQLSIVDLDQGKIVAKVTMEDLTDAPADREVRHKLEAQLCAAVTAYYS